MAVRILGCTLGVIGPVGCSGDRVAVPGAESSTGGSSTGTTIGASSSTSLASSTSTGLGDGTTGPASTSEADLVFVPELDVGSVQFECDPFIQDCPRGEKCLPWDPAGFGSWNGTRCSPIADDPVGVGEPCHVQDDPASGVDDCELGAMCWDVNPKTNEGTCFAQCVGSLDAAFCPDPREYCVLSSLSFDSLLAVCHPLCDPLPLSCPEGETCIPFMDSGPDLGWTCRNDASGELGAHGDPCEYVNVCDPGLICLPAGMGTLPGLPCEGASGCCTEVCDITDPLGDQQCTGAAEGQICQPWYEPDEAPAVLDHVGVCRLPS